MATKTAAPTDGRVEFAPLVLDEDGDFAEALAENLGGDGFGPDDLTVVRFPREGTSWLVNDEPVKEIKGVIVRQQVTRTFYAHDYQSGSTDAPDCSSADGTTGRPAPVEGIAPNPDGSLLFVDQDARTWQYGGNCMKCPLNEWGSDLKGGRGKACREYRNLVVVTETDPLPVVVKVPPTQLSIVRDFAVELTKKRVPFSRALVSLTLTKRDQGADMVLTLDGLIPDETRDRLLPLGKTALALPEARDEQRVLKPGDYFEDAPPPSEEPF